MAPGQRRTFGRSLSSFDIVEDPEGSGSLAAKLERPDLRSGLIRG